MARAKHITPSKGMGLVKLSNAANNIKKTIGVKKFKPTSYNIKFADWIFTEESAESLYLNYIDGQRPAEVAHVLDIANNWDADIAVPLFCVYRTDLKKYIICDGQHHAVAYLTRHKKKRNVMIPVLYVNAANDKVEKKLFGSNDKRKNVPPAALHKTYVSQGIDWNVALNDAVTRADSFIEVECEKKGAITHFQHLKSTFNDFGSQSLTFVLNRIRDNWEPEKVEGIVLRGLSIIRNELRKDGDYTKELFEDIVQASSERFTQKKLGEYSKAVISRSELLIDPDKMKLDPDPVKVACGIISIYNILNNTEYCGTKLYNKLDMPLIADEYGLYPNMDANTYVNEKVYLDVSNTGDVVIPWAWKAAQRYGVDYKGMYDICEPYCALCDSGVELKYGLGFNDDGKTDKEQPNVEHKIALANGGKNVLSNMHITCESCNKLKGVAKKEDAPTLRAIADKLELA